MVIEKLLNQRLVIVILSIAFGVILGFYFKTFDADIRNELFDMSKIQEERYLKYIKKNTPLFNLNNSWSKTIGAEAEDGKFDFNWLAFIIGTILSCLILLINKYIDVKKVFYPYLKEKYK